AVITFSPVMSSTREASLPCIDGMPAQGRRWRDDAGDRAGRKIAVITFSPVMSSTREASLPCIDGMPAQGRRWRD
ncbi:hypothetical protein C5F54_29785, partial [Escherichia coli]|uniref:hypothetical protein n=1 Tax=Escherichia coli TaxID=562 RepID=UPI000E2DB7A9